MGWSTSKSSVPVRKQDSLDKALNGLRGAVKRRDSVKRIVKLAEKVRAAALVYIKAKRSLADEYTDGESRRRQFANLDAEQRQWSEMTIEAIVAEYGDGI